MAVAEEADSDCFFELDFLSLVPSFFVVDFCDVTVRFANDDPVLAFVLVRSFEETELLAKEAEEEDFVRFVDCPTFRH